MNILGVMRKRLFNSSNDLSITVQSISCSTEVRHSEDNSFSNKASANGPKLQITHRSFRHKTYGFRKNGQQVTCELSSEK